MTGLKIAPHLTLPIDLAGETTAILAKRGAGKSNTAKVVVEEILDTGLVQVIALDPVGHWWSLRAGGFRGNVSTLSGLGLITYPGDGRVALTDQGRQAAEPPEAMPTEQDLHDAIYRMVSRPQAALLEQLIAVYPEALTREDLAARAGVSNLSSGFRANVSTLSGFELITYPTQGSVAASDLLFPTVTHV